MNPYFPAQDENIWVGTLRVVLFFPGSRSLKNKRKELQKIKSRLRNNHNFSVSEVGHLENIKRSVIGICMISNDAQYLRTQFDHAFNTLASIIDGRIESSHQSLTPFSPR